MNLRRRLEALEDAVPTPPVPAEPTPADIAWRAMLDTIWKSLSSEHQELVYADFERLRDVEGIIDHHHCWFRHGITRLTYFMVEIAQAVTRGDYTGRLAIPPEVAVSALDTYRTADKRSVAVSLDYDQNNHQHPGFVDPCEHCGWRWWNARVRDELELCPGCDAWLEVRVDRYERDCIGQPVPWFKIPPAKREKVRADVMERAITRLGVEGAEEMMARLEGTRA